MLVFSHTFFWDTSKEGKLLCEKLSQAHAALRAFNKTVIDGLEIRQTSWEYVVYPTIYVVPYIPGG